MKYFTTSQLGPRQSVTPEGYLLCQDVPIARTGQMRYRPGEVPVDPAEGEDVIVIEREADELFRPETLASFEGKPVVNEHPEGDITTENWKKLAVGVCLNVRQGKGDAADLLLADLIIYDPDIIDEIREGKREVSCGYECDYYVQDERPGYGLQYDIRGNHIALVEIGRCGSRCSIGDSDTVAITEKNTMKITTWKELKRRFAAAAKTKDADELAKLAQEMPDEPPPVGTDDDAPTGTGGESHTHVHIHQGGGGVSSGGIVPPTDDDKEGVAAAGAAPAAAAGGDVGARLTACEAGIVEIKAMLQKMSGGGGSGAGEGEAEPVADAAMKKIEGDLKEEAPEGTQDSELVKVKDSAFMEDSFAEAVALAEILSPGIQIPTFDSTAGKFDTYKSICALRRKALLAGNQDTVTSMLIEEARGRRTTDEHLSKLTCDSIRPLFRSAAIAKKRANNLSSTNDHRSLEVVSAGPRTNADINKRNADYWAKH